MKERLFRLAVLVNLSPALLAALFYRGGAPGVWLLMIGSHIALYLLNMKSADTLKQLAFLGAEHILATIAAHVLYSSLYSRFVCDDIPGRMISRLGLLAGVIITSVMLAVSLIKRKRG